MDTKELISETERLTAAAIAASKKPLFERAEAGTLVLLKATGLIHEMAQKIEELEPYRDEA